jgi:electron transfer flavoprotein alpha subunit
MLKTGLSAVSIGEVDDTELASLGNYGAEKILKIEDGKINRRDDQVYTDILSQVAKSENARVIVFSHNNTGKALASRLSVRLQSAVGSGLIGLPESVEPFIVRKKIFSGKAFTSLELKSEVKILTLMQNSFELCDVGVTPTIQSFNIQAGDPKVIVKDVHKQTGKILLNDAEIVVSGGRGMKSADNWGILEELAEVLDAGLACSRPVSDEGWRSHEEHTGQTGKIIAPNLYIAAGISGAIQHMAGVSSSKCIVAVNSDTDAPVFEYADYGIAGDALKVIPALTEAVKNARGK